MSIEIPNRQSRLQDQAAHGANWNTEQANSAESLLSHALLIPASILIGLSPFSLAEFQRLPVGNKLFLFFAWVLLFISMAAGAMHFKICQAFHRENAKKFQKLLAELQTPGMSNQSIDEIYADFQKDYKASSPAIPLVIQAIALALAISFFIGILAGKLLMTFDKLHVNA